MSIEHSGNAEKVSPPSWSIRQGLLDWQRLGRLIRPEDVLHIEWMCQRFNAFGIKLLKQVYITYNATQLSSHGFDFFVEQAKPSQMSDFANLISANRRPGHQRSSLNFGHTERLRFLWSLDFAAAQALYAHPDALHHTVQFNKHALQIGSELPAAYPRYLSPDATQIFRATSTGNRIAHYWLFPAHWTLHTHGLSPQIAPVPFPESISIASDPPPTTLL
ncbi:MAG: hypothetical protein KatS3mg105_1672 [Gemmatales bacterium]|nr:MAG: hypothetical protein KatS3mg105_1672 [Gemmatales bacterium]